MSNLENLGPTGEPLGDIPDAEFVEVSNPDTSAQSRPYPGQTELSGLWHSLHIIPKILIASSPIWLLVTCAWQAGTPRGTTTAQNDMTPEQLAAATDIGAVVGADAAS